MGRGWGRGSILLVERLPRVRFVLVLSQSTSSREQANWGQGKSGTADAICQRSEAEYGTGSYPLLPVMLQMDQKSHVLTCHSF